MFELFAKHRRREGKHEQIRDELYCEVSSENLELIEKLYLAIERLPKNVSGCVHMVCMKDIEISEVADYLGISINTVKTQMGRPFNFYGELSVRMMH